MAKRTTAELKGWFRKGQYPTESQFADWMDSYRHKDEKVGMGEIAGLPEALNNKADSAEVDALGEVVKGYDASMRQIVTAQEAQGEEMEELRATMTGRSYTLDFGATGSVVQDVNMEGRTVVIEQVRLFNVSRLCITVGGLVRHEVDPENPGGIAIPAGALASWEIEREGDAPAAVGVRCVRGDT